MQLYLIHFSPTGGTKKVCEALAAAWAKPFVTINLLKENNRLAQTVFTPEDVCIVAMPVYGGRIPDLAAKRLSVAVGNGATAFPVAVYGNRAVEDALLELRDLLTDGGFVCRGAAEAVAQHSTVSDFGAGRPDPEDLEQLRTFSQQFFQAAKGGATLPEKLIPGHRPYKVFGGSALKPAGDETCIKCGTCAAWCPAGAIPADDPSGVWADLCISCMGCVSVCPTGARHLDPERLAAHAQKLAPLCGGRKPNVVYTSLSQEEGSR